MITRTLALMLVSALALAGCADDPNLFVAVGDWSDDELAIVQDAMDEWCESSDGRYCAHLGDGSDNAKGNSVIVLTEDHPDRYGRTRFADHWWDTIEIDNERGYHLWRESLRRVVLHELGHHFHHSPYHLPAGNVMEACGESTHALTALDVAGEYRREYDCE